MRPHLSRAAVVSAGFGAAVICSLGAEFSAEGAQFDQIDRVTVAQAYADPSVKRPASAFGPTSEIHFQGRTKLDSRMDVGFIAELNLATDVCAVATAACAGGGKVDEVYISVSSSLGQFAVTQDGGSRTLGVPEPLVTKFTRVKDLALMPQIRTAIEPLSGTPPRHTSASYYTPRLSGIQLGAGVYAQDLPPVSDLRLGALTPRDQRERNPSGTVYGVGANYAHSFHGLTLNLGGSLLSGSTVVWPGAQMLSPRWSAGAELGYAFSGRQGALIISGAYRDVSGPYRDLNNPPSAGVVSAEGLWDAGISYTRGGLSISGSTISGKSYTAQAGYRLSPGVQMAAGIQFWDYQLQAEHWPGRAGPQRADSRSTVVFIETALDF